MLKQKSIRAHAHEFVNSFRESGNQVAWNIKTTNHFFFFLLILIVFES